MWKIHANRGMCTVRFAIARFLDDFRHKWHVNPGLPVLDFTKKPNKFCSKEDSNNIELLLYKCSRYVFFQAYLKEGHISQFK